MRFSLVFFLFLLIPFDGNSTPSNNQSITQSYWYQASPFNLAYSNPEGSWKGVRTKNINLGFVSHGHWIKVELKNNSENQEWYLTLDNSRLDYVDFYFFSNTKVATFYSGDHRGLSDQLSSYPTFRFKLPPSQSGELFIRLQSNAQISFTPVIRSSFEYGRYQAERYYSHILYGVIFVLFLIFQFSTYRESMVKVNIWYSCGLLFGFLFILFHYGEGNLLFFPESTGAKNQAIFVAASLSMFCFTQFIALYVDVKKVSSTLHWLVCGHLLLCCLLTLVILLPIGNITRVYLVAFETNVTCFVSLFAAFIINYKEKSIWSRFIAAPLVFSVISVIVYEGTFLGVLPYSVIASELILWTLPFDVIFISISFFYKHKLIQKENEKLRITLRGLTLTDSVSKVPEVVPDTVKIESALESRLKNVNAEEVLVKLSQYLEFSKVFMQPGLTLETVASNLEVRPDQLSAIINSKLNTSFSNLMNQRRLVEAEVMLVSEPKSSILEISLQCGFGSKSSFNKLFKQQFDTTPSQYRKIRRYSQEHQRSPVD